MAGPFSFPAWTKEHGHIERKEEALLAWKEIVSCSSPHRNNIKAYKKKTYKERKNIL